MRYNKLLTADPRFAALVVLLENTRTGFSISGSTQALATHHGCLAHSAGSVHAVVTLEGQLREIIDPKPKRGGMERAAEEA